MVKTKTEVTVVNADFKTVVNYDNVLIKIPDPAKDKYFKFIAAHDISVNEQIVHNANRYRRGDKIDGQWITKYFSVDESHFGKDIIAKVEVVEKTDHTSHEAKTFILNIVPQNSAKPQFRLKVGCDKKMDHNSLYIPGTSKFINFEPIN